MVLERIAGSLCARLDSRNLGTRDIQRGTRLRTRTMKHDEGELVLLQRNRRGRVEMSECDDD